MSTIIARCVHGLEWVCADEISSRLPMAHGLRLARREVTLQLPPVDSVDSTGTVDSVDSTGTVDSVDSTGTVDSGLSDLRTVDDVFVEVGRVEGVGATRDALGPLARRVADLPYDMLARGPLELPAAPRVDVVASVEGRRTYSRFDVENAVGPLVASRLGGSYLARSSDGRAPGEPDVSVRLFLRGPTAIAAARLGRRPLHRRPYKQDTGPGTLHPPVAAALARLASPPAGAIWAGAAIQAGGAIQAGAAAPPAGVVLLDPFCGDGTIAIESALALPGTRVVGSDIDAGRLGNAAANADRAGVRPAFVQADAGRLPVRPGSVGVVVTNPPWNLAVDAGGWLGASLEEFWVRLREPLAVDARVCVIADEGLDAPAALRRLGLPVALAARIRLAGRVSHVVLCGAPGGATPALGGGLARWGERALAEGVVTESGF